jgi:hypothetical protein
LKYQNFDLELVRDKSLVHDAFHVLKLKSACYQDINAEADFIASAISTPTTHFFPPSKSPKSFAVGGSKHRSVGAIGGQRGAKM